MKYFDKEAKINKLTWSVIFADVKGEGGGERDSSAVLCQRKT